MSKPKWEFMAFYDFQNDSTVRMDKYLNDGWEIVNTGVKWDRLDESFYWAHLKRRTK